MFGKLMKYELRYLIRYFAPMWVIVLTLCTLFRLTVHPDINGMVNVEGAEAVLPVVLIMLAMFSIITMMIVATVVLLQRFYKGMFGDEGYLMFTLPVTTGSLIHSKALSAVIMQLVTGGITVAGFFVMVSYEEVWSEVIWSFPEFMENLNISVLNVGVIGFWAMIVMIASAACSMYMVYLAISVGQLWKKHPIAGAVAAYYVINMALTFIEGAIVRLLGDAAINVFEEWLLEINISDTAVVVAIMIFFTVCMLLISAVSFVGTKLIMDKKLNIA